MRHRIVWYLLALVALQFACGGSQHSEYVEIVPASHNGGAPLGDWDLRATRSYAQGPPHSGSWAPTHTFHAEHFTIEYPASSRAYQTTDERFSQPILWIENLPECTAACDMTVIISHLREGVGLDSVVRIMTAPGPKAAGQPEAHVIDSTTVGGHVAIRVAIQCYHCTETTIVTERHSWVAEIGIVMCKCDSTLAPKLDTIARSFRWSDPPAAPIPEP